MRPPTRLCPIRRDWNGVVCFSCGKSGHAATRCPALDESFPFMLPGWRAEKTPRGFVMVSPRSVVARKTSTDLGEGFTTRISSNVRPQDPGGGALMIAAPRRMMDVDVSDTPDLSGRGGGDLSRSPPEFRWCWSRRPGLGALHVWGVHVMTRGNDSRLERLLATTVLDCRRLRGRCPIPG